MVYLFTKYEKKEENYRSIFLIKNYFYYFIIFKCKYITNVSLLNILYIQRNLIIKKKYNLHKFNKIK